MAGYVEPEQLFFVGQLIFGEPVGDLRQRFFGMLFESEAPEQSHLAAEAIFPSALSALDGGIDCGE